MIGNRGLPLCPICFQDIPVKPGVGANVQCRWCEAFVAVKPDGHVVVSARPPRKQPLPFTEEQIRRAEEETYKRAMKYRDPKPPKEPS